MNVLGLKVDSIDMSWAFGKGHEHPERVQFLTFTIDGVDLTTKFGGDLTALTLIEPEFRTTNLQRLAGHEVPLPTFEPRFERSFVHRMLGLRGIPHAFVESAFDDGRVGLLYCPCGDMDCGVLSTRIEFKPETVTWHEVAWQTAYQPFEQDHQSFLGETTFTFERDQYDSLLGYLLNADWSERVPDPGGL